VEEKGNSVYTIAADAIAIKASIEFCLNISAIDFLFTDILTIF
jgi:hypothetical protein